MSGAQIGDVHEPPCRTAPRHARMYFSGHADGTRRAPYPAMRASSASAFSIDVEFSVLNVTSPPVKPARRVAWPVMLCAFFALLAAGAAVTESPLGRHSTLRPYADAVRGGAIALWGDAVAFTRR
jgi:hypothetical protein